MAGEVGSLSDVLTREEWVAKREAMHGIGGSEAAAVFSLSPYMSAYELYLIKRGEAPPKEETEAMRWGRRLESAVAEEYADRYGRTLRKIDDFHPSDKYPFMFASTDRVIDGDPRGLGGYEGKALSGFTKLDDGVPEHIWIQVQHYYAVMVEIRWFDVAMLIGGQRLECREIERDNEAIEMLVDGERELMRRVELGDPPKPDGLAATGALLKRMYPMGSGRTLVFDSEDARTEVAEFVRLKEQMRQRKERLGELKYGFQARMQDAEIAILPGWGKVTWKTVRPKPELKIDLERLQKEQPEIYQRYVRKEPKRPYRRFLTCPLKVATTENEGDEDGN